MEASILNRREFMAGTTILAGNALPRAESTNYKIRAITKGPGFHWFAYYDKLQFDPSNRFVLGMKVGFEHRSPRPDDVIEVGMVDLKENDRWIPLGCASDTWVGKV